MADTNELHAPPESASRVHYGPLWGPQFQALIDRGAGTPVAVLVCHGMGQQVRYETISSVANAICTEAEARGGAVQPIDVRLCSFGDEFLPRAEVSWKDLDQQDRSVHVYEAYWAPLTEGKVSYWDTIKFLLLAAWNGLQFSRPLVKSNFFRWMFGGPKKLGISRFSWFGIVSILLVVALQVAIISYVAIEVGQQYKAALAQTAPTLLGHGFWHFAAACLYWLSPFLPGIHSVLKPVDFHQWWTSTLWLLAWFALIAEAVLAKYFVVEYVGDVAAYVSPYKDSKFDQLRQQIQQVGLHVGKILYGFSGATTSPIPQYHRIVVVGHSLGSVLAYDTLNALINLDTASLGARKRNVTGRTRALITFGSPLDKTAFIFRMQASNKQDWIREQLANSVQPLIVDYGQYRPHTFRWVNIWSPMDIISGSLDYYDDPDVPANDPRHVQNMVDRNARTPIVAHIQYWNNPLLREQLYDCLI